jgi:uncharacterized repeat protein (TIGR01451 family)
VTVLGIGAIENIAQVWTSDQHDPDSTPGNGVPAEDDQDSAIVTGVEVTDLAISKTVDNPTPSEGDSVLFTITVVNNGPRDTTGVVVTDALPAGLSYVRDSGFGAYNLVTNAWDIGALAVGGSASLTITALVSQGTAGQTLTNVAEITETGIPDPDPTNDRAEASVSVTETGGAGGGLDDCTGKVIINEVAWAGTAADPTNEWIELRNVGTAEVDLTDWSLRWRKKNPITVEDLVWKVVPLNGALQPAGTSACELATLEEAADVEFEKRQTDTLSWLVTALPLEDDGSYFTLERISDDTISNEDANVVYDTIEPYSLELEDVGDVIELVNADGLVVDTANAFLPIADGWPAGDSSTHGTMERTDPLGPDIADNWHTNIGIVTKGRDADNRPLIATARAMNSESLQEIELFADLLQPSPTQSGARLEVGLDLTQADRREAGWPWIRVTRPLADIAGGGGALQDTSLYSFSSRFALSTYWLGIDTTGMSPGEHLVWIVFGEGRAVLVPIQIVP